jgi:hypothetical protein
MPIPPCGQRWRYLAAVPGLATVWKAGWPGACAAVLVTVVIVVYRLLAERERRKTLFVTYLHAPAGTVVVQGQSSAGPQMWVRVGSDPGPVPAPIVIWRITPSPASRMRMGPAWRRRR